MTPMKPIAAIEGHRSNRERARLAKEEEKLLTGSEMVEDDDTAADPVAHAKFIETMDLFKALGKSDRVYSDIINRYAQLYSIWRAQKQAYSEKGTGYGDLIKTHDAMFKIERENCMTLAAALRSIPRKPEKATSPLMEILNS